MQTAEEPPMRLGIEDSARDPSCKLWYALPSGFVDIPLDFLNPEPGTEAAASFENLVYAVVEAVPEQVRGQYFEALREVHAVAKLLQNEGVIGCSLGMHLADDGSSASSLITVALTDIDWAPPKVTALRAVSLREAPENVGVLTLPGNRPGAVSDTLARVPGEGERLTQDLYQCNVYIPSPSGVQLAVLTLSTTAVGTRRHYRDMMEGIAYTVSFEDPMPEIERAVRGDEESTIKNDIVSDFG